MHTSNRNLEQDWPIVNNKGREIITLYCRTQCAYGPAEMECLDCLIRSHDLRDFSDEESARLGCLEEAAEIPDPGPLGTNCIQCGRPMPAGRYLCPACRQEKKEQEARARINHHDPGPGVPFDVRSTCLGLGGIFEAMTEGGHNEKV